MQGYRGLVKGASSRPPAETFLRHAGAQNSDLQSYNRLKDRDITYESQHQFNGRSAIERMR